MTDSGIGWAQNSTHSNPDSNIIAGQLSITEVYTDVLWSVMIFFITFTTFYISSVVIKPHLIYHVNLN